jgi:uncharacterized membrane protein YeaQ/YmgE (transglycosylase-associated protein family)
MSIFDKMSRGWQISMSSLKVLRANKQLLVFPILSGLTLLVIAASFFAGIFFNADRLGPSFLEEGRGTMYLFMLAGYIVGYFVIVFFNMALIHCTKLYFEGEEATVSRGLQFSMSRIGTILQWALFAGTIGTLLKIAQDNLGWIGKIIIGLIGFAWSIATFFVVPILAYEQSSPQQALKRSGAMMKERWGDRIGASFSFGLLQLLIFAAFGIVGVTVSAFINETLGIVIFAMCIPIIFVVSSALHTIFISAVYHSIDNDIDVHFNRQMFDQLFIEKKK